MVGHVCNPRKCEEEDEEFKEILRNITKLRQPGIYETQKATATKQNKTNSRQIDFKSDSHFTLCFSFLLGNEAESSPSYLEM